MSEEIAKEQTRNTEQIRALLGDRHFDDYLDYKQTTMERMQVARFNERLAPADKLTGDQKQRLMRLVRTQFDQAMQRQQRSMGRLLPPIGTRVENMQAMMEKSLIESMEISYRQMEEDSRLLVARLPEVLTPNQVAEFAKMEEEKLAAQRRYTEEKRVAAGLSPEIATGPLPPGPELAAGKVKIAVYVRANEAEPVQVEYVTENGKPVPMFDVHEGLWVEVTPTLYQDGWANIAYQFYEERNGQRRSLSGQHSLRQTGAAASQGPLGVGGGMSIVSGTKTYSVRMDARVSSAQ
jgi:hypothetical protein